MKTMLDGKNILQDDAIYTDCFKKNAKQYSMLSMYIDWETLKHKWKRYTPTSE